MMYIGDMNTADDVYRRYENYSIYIYDAYAHFSSVPFSPLSPPPSFSSPPPKKISDQIRRKNAVLER